VRVGDLAQIVDLARRVDLGRPEEPCAATDLVFGDKAIGHTARRMVEPHRRVAVLVADHHHALGAGKGVFHR
jgi:hypothetical protein